MDSQISVSTRLLQDVASLKLPKPLDDQVQLLMNRNNEGLLGAQEKMGLAELVEWIEKLSLLQAVASNLLGQGPGGQQASSSLTHD
jgi:hypothetical protein